MSNANNPINNTVGASISGVTNTLTVTNPSNTASSAARETITVGGGTAADPTLNFNVSGVTDWEMGIDNSVSDNLTISQSTALGTKDTWRMTTAGQRTMPLQPFFKAAPVAQPNVTGDGTVYTIKFTNVSSNIGGSYDGTSTFMAPITGIYWFAFTYQIGGITAAHTAGSWAFGLTPGNVTVFEYNPANVCNSSGNITLNGFVSIPLTTGNTAFCQLLIAGGTKTVAISNITTSYFTGGLLF